MCETAIIPNIDLRERVCTPNNSTIDHTHLQLISIDSRGWRKSSKLRSNRAQLAGKLLRWSLPNLHARAEIKQQHRNHTHLFISFPSFSSSNRILSLPHSFPEYWYPYNGQKKKNLVGLLKISNLFRESARACVCECCLEWMEEIWRDWESWEGPPEVSFFISSTRVALHKTLSLPCWKCFLFSLPLVCVCVQYR